MQAKVGLIGTICNMVGDERLETERTTPESFELQGLLARMRDAGCTHVVMECSSHALFLHRVDEIPFAVGAFTNLTEDHLDFHKTMEEYGKAKAILFRHCAEGVFNLDDPSAQTMMEQAACKCFTVGCTERAELRAEHIDLAADHVAMDVVEGTQRAHLRVGIPGRFTVSNSLVTLGIARKLGIGLDEAVRALSGAKGVKGPKMGAIAAEYADLVIVTSDNPRTEDPNAIIREILAGMEGTKTPLLVEENRRKAIRLALQQGQKDDMIILAGKGHETYQILGTEKTHLDEREEVAAALCETE